MNGEQIVALIAGLVLLLGCAMAIRSSQRAGDGVVSALALFLAIWSLDLLLFAIPWVRYTPTSTQTWVAIYGSLVAFTGGCVMASRLSQSPRRVDREQINAQRFRRLWLAFAVMSLVGFADFIYAIDVTIGWHALFDHPDLVRITESTSQKFKATYGPLKLLTYFALPAFLLWTVGTRLRMFTGRWSPATYLGWLCVVPFLFTADRTLLLTALIWAGCFHLVWQPVHRPRRLLAVALCVLVSLVAIFTVLGNRVSKTIDQHPEIKARLTTQTFSSVALPYVYLTANPPELSQLTRDSTRPHTYGQMTVLPAVKLLHAVGLAGTPPEEVGAFYAIPFESFNAYTWLGSFYLDFGLIGALLLPALAGFGFTLLVVSAQRTRRLARIWLASLALSVIVFSPLVNRLSTTLTWEYAILGPLAAVILRADPSPGAWARKRWSQLAKAPRRLTLGVGLLALVVGGYAIVRRLERGPVRVSAGALSRELASAMSRAVRMRTQARFPSSNALASRLHVDDPARDYVPMSGAVSPPAEKGVIGVNSTGAALTLVARTDTGVVRLGSTAPPTTPGSLGPRENLVSNNYFDSGLNDGWATSSNGVGAISIVPAPAWRGHAALLLTGRGTAAPGSTVVNQLFTALPSATAGTLYDLSFVARRRRLGRGVISWIKLDYVDGSHEAALAGPLGDPRDQTGIPAGTDRNWRRFGVSARAAKPLADIELFICDTGPAPLTGRVQISDVSLVVRRPGGRPFGAAPLSGGA